MLDVDVLDESMTPLQAAEVLHCSLAEVHELVKSGELPTVRVALGLLIDRAAVEARAATPLTSDALGGGQ